MPTSPFNGPSDQDKPVTFRDIRSLRNGLQDVHIKIQDVHTKLQVLNPRLQVLEVEVPCPGTACTSADVDSTDIRCVECPYNPDVLPPLPDDYVGPLPIVHEDL